jgi:queuosine precursor transporter
MPNNKQLNYNFSLTKGYRYLIILIMLYMSIMICNVLLTDRYILLTNNLFVLGGSFTSPIFFILGDIIAEIYGYSIAKQVLWSGFACQFLFAVICQVVVGLPYPNLFQHDEAYTIVLKPLLYLCFSSFAAYLIAGLLNAYILTKWKVLMLGKHFWLRSLGSSTIAEALYSAIAIFMMEIGHIPFSYIYKVVLTSYLIKVSYSIIFAAPVNLLVNYMKEAIYSDTAQAVDVSKQTINTSDEKPVHLTVIKNV